MFKIELGDSSFFQGWQSYVLFADLAKHVGAGLFEDARNRKLVYFDSELSSNILFYFSFFFQLCEAA